MKVRYIFGALCALTIMNLHAVGGTRPDFANKGQYIELVTQGGLCGGVKIAPIAEKGKAGLKVGLEAKKVSYGIFNLGQPKIETISKIYSLPTEGQRFEYDWAGIGSKSHYRIYCYTKSTTLGRLEWDAANCEDVVTIPQDDIKHNRGCKIIGPAGPEADYGPLNMNKG